MYDLMKNRAKEIEKQVAEWRHYFHQHPEPSMGEKETTAEIAKIMRELGYKVRVGCEGHPDLGVIADLNEDVPGKRIALRADIDALKVTEELQVPWKSVNVGYMHACGHDSHIAMALGAAKLIAEHKEEYKGKIRFIFQPAEEIGAGAKAIIAAGALEGVDFIIGQHIWSPIRRGLISVRPGAFMASADKFEVTITGKGGHGSAPQLSIDPVVAACALVQSWQALVSRETAPLDAAVLTVANISAGTLFNIIPSTAYMQGTTRTFNQKVRENLAQRMGEMAKDICAAYRCTADFTYHWMLRPTVNDAKGAEFVRQELSAMFGEDHVIDGGPDMAAEDFSEYQALIPGCFMFLGTGDPEHDMAYPQHHPKYTVDDAVLYMGVAGMAGLACRWLEENE